MRRPGHARARGRTAAALTVVAGSGVLLALAYTASTTDALTLAVTTQLALCPLMVAASVMTGRQLVRRRADIRFGRRELLVMLVASAAVVLSAAAAGVAGYHLTSP